MPTRQEYDRVRALRNTAAFNRMKGYEWASLALEHIADQLEQLQPDVAAPEQVGYIDVVGERVGNRLMYPIGTYQDEFASCEFYIDEDGCVVYWLNDRSTGELPAFQLNLTGLPEHEKNGRTDLLKQLKRTAEMLLGSELISTPA